MDFKLSTSKKIFDSKEKSLVLPGSKSESNRLLVLQNFFPGIQIKNLSNSEDTLLLEQALMSNDTLVDIQHAGTAMRFLTAYFAVEKEREVLLTGSSRMKDRPIKILVEALRSLGAEIAYLEKEGYPPLSIKGKQLEGGSLVMSANVSSQYISALLLIAPKLKQGIEICLQDETTSLPYIHMTLQLLDQLGIKASFEKNTIKVFSKEVPQNSFKVITVESDWSAASYYYTMVALAPVGASIKLGHFFNKSIQGDSCIVQIYKGLGVETRFLNGSIIIKKVNKNYPFSLDIKLDNTPDIAQTLAVTCLGLGISCNLSGLHTLKIKETNRLAALKKEIEKFGVTVKLTGKSIHFKAHDLQNKENELIAVETYNDHRMAMAFATLAIRLPVIIKNVEVVKKSYPAFWQDLERLGFNLEKLD